MHKSFFLKLSGLVLILAGIIHFSGQNHAFDGYLSFVWLSLLFLALVTCGVYFIMLRAMGMDAHKNFVTAFAAGFGLKSLASLAFLCYFIFMAPISDKHFIFPFFFMYFLFTGLLVWHLWQLAKQKP